MRDPSRGTPGAIFHSSHTHTRSHTRSHTCYLPGGMPMKAYMLKDTQSDENAAYFLNPKYITGKEWDDAGHMIMMFIQYTANGHWMGSKYFENLEDMFFNSMFSYYFLLCQVYLVVQKYGNDWPAHFLPLTLLRNIWSNCGHFASRC